MDKKLKGLNEIKSALHFEGSIEELKSTQELIDYCFKNFVIVRLKPNELQKAQRERYIDFLVALTKTHISENKSVDSWEAFKQLPDTRKVSDMLHEFGVKGEVFRVLEEKHPDETELKSKTSLTVEEFHELCQIQFNYDGSLGSFKKMLVKNYGSFAEYCISKGYDINNTKWENMETAVRVAKKLGSIEVIRKRSKSLLKFLEENDLLDQIS